MQVASTALVKIDVTHIHSLTSSPRAVLKTAALWDGSTHMENLIRVEGNIHI